MTHKNYIYDTERRYNAALLRGDADAVTRQLYMSFCVEKRKLETAAAELNAIQSTVRCGQDADKNAETQARRRCNGAECELSVLSRRISLRILQAKRTNTGRYALSA